MKISAQYAFIAFLVYYSLPAPCLCDCGSVNVYEKMIEIPTYSFSRTVSSPPIFSAFDQGLYPYLTFDRSSLSPAAERKEYAAILLENEYLELTIVPELGGRIWYTREKHSSKSIFWENRTVKPTGYNPRGAWPAGNLEVYGPYDVHMTTWPGEPWAFTTKKNTDSSASIILSHLDHFFRDKLTAEFRLYPGINAVEIGIHLYNPNPVRNRYMLWTNAAFDGSDETEFLYPMTKTIGHDTSKFDTWPVSNGIDFSRQKNNLHMLGVFGLDLYDNYIGAYNHQTDRGLICYTDRSLARGAKMWTWGTGSAARRQMETYTDREGPYVEIQSGRFVWDGVYEYIEPGMSDGWKEWWYAPDGIGGVVKANEFGALNVERIGAGRFSIAFDTTRFMNQASFGFRRGNGDWERMKVTLDPNQPFRIQQTMNPNELFAVRFQDRNERTIIHYEYPDTRAENAWFAEDSIPHDWAPEEELSAEALYRKGIAEDKFGRMEAANRLFKKTLDKEPSHSRALVALGIQAIHRFECEIALDYFTTALRGEPDNGEARYYSALVRKELGDLNQARREFNLVIPNCLQYVRAQYELGILDLQQRGWDEAKNRFRHCLEINGRDTKIVAALAYSLRKLGEEEEAAQWRNRLLELDPTSSFAVAEKIFDRAADRETLQVTLEHFTGNHPQGYLELATQYWEYFAWQEAVNCLQIGSRRMPSPPQQLYHFYRAFLLDKAGDCVGAAEQLHQAVLGDASDTIPIPIQPFRYEDMKVLQWAADQSDSLSNQANYFLGNLFWSLGRKKDAIQTWSRSVENSANFLLLRNFGLGNVLEGDAALGFTTLSKAIRLRPEEQDTVLDFAKLQAQHGRVDAALILVNRLYEQSPESDKTVQTRALMLAQKSEWESAAKMIEQHTFNPEHRSDSLVNLYKNIQLSLAADDLKNHKKADALNHLRLADHPPANLGADDFAARTDTRIAVLRAVVTENTEDWRSAAEVTPLPNPSQRFYHALALQHTGKTTEANREFQQLKNTLKTDGNERQESPLYLEALLAAQEGNIEGSKGLLNRILKQNAGDLSALTETLWIPMVFRD